jgi:hypothetical protein
MKNYFWIVVSAMIILGILVAGCTSSASSTVTPVAPSSSQPEFNNGDVMGADTSSATGIIIVSFDSSSNSYTIEDATKNADGTWQISNNPSQRVLPPTVIEKVYPTKIGTISSLSQTSQNVGSSSSQNTASNMENTPSSSASASTGVQIVVNYDGVWSGSYGDAGATQSIDGTGSKTITLDNPNSLVSAEFQKKDNSASQLTVEILDNGQVIKSGSTTAAYGLVVVATSLNGGSSSSNINPTSAKTVQVTVNYNGLWQGSYGDLGGMQSVDGTGSQTYTLTNPNYEVSVSFQKKDNSASELSVEIVENGNVLKQGSTTAAYGVVVLSTAI